MRPERRLGALARAHRGAFLAALSVSAVTGVFAVVQAAVLAHLLARAFLERPEWEALGPGVGAFAALVVARAVLTWAGRRLSHHLAARVKAALHGELHAKLLALGPAFTRGERSGELIATATEGIEQLDAFFSRVLPQRVVAGLVPLGVIVAVALKDGASGALLAVAAPWVPVFMILIGKQAQARNERQWVELRRMAAHFLDVIQGLPTLKLVGRSRYQLEVIGRMTERFASTTLGVLRVAFLSALVLELVATLSTALLAVTLGVRLVSGTVGFEVALLVLLLAPELFAPLRALGAQHHAGMAAATAAERIFALLDEPLTRAERAAPRAVPSRMQVRFEDVTCQPPGSPVPTLEGFELTVSPGERVALVGPSGVGKSTVLDLLLGFREPSRGRILVDGVPLAALPLEAWRKQVAWVSQCPYFFDTTLRDNLLLAQPGAADAELMRILREVELGPVIARLPQGLDTPLGERGLRLSGGQRQRLALARALLQDAPLLLLDEPTSQLDDVTEAAVLQGVKRLLGREKTLLLVTHRPAPLRLADRVVVLSGRAPRTPAHTASALLHRAPLVGHS
ncbi:thiol reductant ABC exporter subunit CydD [Corallococcus sicarius]|uniref:Thiol reductant ABC exporter subunit CydD n=1 Tax=Corallococcus sicarius TaxID=2316726 RepID=A0A3A8NPH0_9BACT|nr:thiol reductant ABC exporter subunit CydD [Corallococcus sicarius]RKH46118.1 thiol reductant ABC exporter subunit CydD [Corallococcus sicarius]